MIDFRYHIVSLVAVFLALGVGILLGSGPLDEQIQGTLQTQTDQLREEQQHLREEITSLNKEVDLGDDFAKEVAGPITANQLTARTVAVFALPGVDKGLVDETTKSLQNAGATVTGTVTLTDFYVDPSKAQSPMEDLALRLVPAGVTFPKNASVMDRVGTVVARSTVTSDPDQSTKVDQSAAELISGMQELGALEVTGQPGRRAELAVVVAPPAPTDKNVKAETVDAANAALLSLTTALDRGSRGVVVTGAKMSAAQGGFVQAVRGSSDQAKGVSTIDVADTPVGHIALVLALVEQTRGAAGDYGAGQGVDSVVPDISQDQGS
ncbi:MAG TPA: copper transporter [Actinomycetes bacterium]